MKKCILFAKAVCTEVLNVMYRRINKNSMKSRMRYWGIGLSLMFVWQHLLAAPDITLYSSRETTHLGPLIDQFTDITGFEVRVVTGKPSTILKRLKSEGSHNFADLILLTGAERLEEAKKEGLLLPVELPVIRRLVPGHLRDPEHHWFALSQQTRAIFYSKKRVDRNRLSTYEALAKPEWKGRLCTPSASFIYNKSLVSSILAHEGSYVASFWLSNFVSNFARQEADSDAQQLRLIAQGQCDIAVANLYDYGKMISGDDLDSAELAQEIAVFWPNQDDRGAHINISGVGFSAGLKDRSEEVQQKVLLLAEYLLSEAFQYQYAAAYFEYPVRSKVVPSDLLISLGQYSKDTLSLSELSEHVNLAERLMRKAKWPQ